MSTIPGGEKNNLEGSINGMQTYFVNIEKSLEALNMQSADILRLGPKIEDVEKEISPFKEQIRLENIKVGNDIQGLKEMVREDVRMRVLGALRERIQSQLRLEIASQVKAQFDVQIREYIPIPLADQVEQNKAQIDKVKYSHLNAEARRENSNIQDTDYDEPLEAIFMENGEKSEVYPADLRSLFAYDDDSLKKLLEDYALPVDESMEIKINRFMSHIGITSWRLIPSPVDKAGAERR